MSLITAVRRTARHRGKSVTDLQREIASRECEVVRLTLLLDELGGAYNLLKAAYEEQQTDQAAELKAARQATTAANERARRLDGELAEAKAQVRRLTADLTALRATVQPRDTSRLEDQTTEPIDARQLQAEIGDDYLDRTRQAWHGPIIPVKPLAEAPFAMDRPNTSPTDLPGDTTLTIRVHAA